ncbi:MAG: [protein-PII] uridylyltransferase [Planctomycetia bacterium 21-64-5]|nr:MAG: [protein-PII] uridylyltransferase [Planctomycetia bacterium 21-64-5]HQU41875.1 [protein-PII] uridylyltransferase [Pirellulales bacterium]
MSIAPGLRPHLREAKRLLAEGREELKRRHEQGASGSEIGAALSDLFDQLILELFQVALEDLGQTGPEGLAARMALVPHGGYGRRDVAPYSDVDLMLLVDKAARAEVAPLAQRMLRDVFDVGLTVGQSVRTPAEAWRLARKDPIIWTSLVESRLLAGSVRLFRDFAVQFQRRSRRAAAAIVALVDKSRTDERLQYGETVYLLEPNVKRSRGGLRDIQFLRWMAFARHGTPDFGPLSALGALAAEDVASLARAKEFLLHLRNDMHFHAGKANDLLDRTEQLRLAESYKYRGDDGLLPVEQFMREYFRLTEGVSQVVMRFMAATTRGPRWSELLAPLVSHRFDGEFRVGPWQIQANARGLAALKTDLTRILHLAVIANLYNKPIAHATCEAIRAAARALPDEISAEASERFIALLNQPARLGGILRSLHETRVLEKLIPAFDHARCLLQFNEYHKYTVDEHCIRAVEHASDFGNDAGPLGHVYRHIKRKWLLHLALLLHDLGKGYPGDHSDVGREIAGQVARRLHLSPDDSEKLVFLVHKHLMMSHLAFRRDTNDEQLVVRFAVEVGSPELMEMLFVLTAADLSAVGQGVLNAWKIDVLADLHRRAMQHLAGDAPAMNLPDYLEECRRKILDRLPADDSAWFERQLAALPASYLGSTSPDEAAHELAQLRELRPGGVIALGRYQPDRGAVEYKIGTYEAITPGVFHKLTGALTGRGLQILAAEIYTLAEGLIFDRFYVHDPDFSGPPPRERTDEVTAALKAALCDTPKPPTFRRIWRPGADRRQAVLPRLPTRVQIDNHTSDRFTIIDIFAHDRAGLLYTITRSLFEKGLSVGVAKIGTYLDQVVDVFYVTDQQGQKLLDEERLGTLRQQLLDEIEAFERQ